MTNRRYFQLVAVMAVTLQASCYKKNKEYESVSPTISAARFRTIATIADGSSRSDLRMSAQARETLHKGGWNAVRAAGRWENIAEALPQVCGPQAEQKVDGLLVVKYNHLVLYDCQTTRPAYEIQGAPEAGGMALQQLIERLIKYLRTPPTTTPAPGQ